MGAAIFICHITSYYFFWRVCDHSTTCIMDSVYSDGLVPKLGSLVACSIPMLLAANSYTSQPVNNLLRQLQTPAVAASKALTFSSLGSDINAVTCRAAIWCTSQQLDFSILSSVIHRHLSLSCQAWHADGKIFTGAHRHAQRTHENTTLTKAHSSWLRH